MTAAAGVAESARPDTEVVFDPATYTGGVAGSRIWVAPSAEENSSGRLSTD